LLRKDEQNVSDMTGFPFYSAFSLHPFVGGLVIISPGGRENKAPVPANICPLKRIGIIDLQYK
jgi:hypothetical protein